MSDMQKSPLFIFEMANNHAGSVDHARRIIAALRDVSRDFPFNFGVKLQYRDIDTFIHPDYRNRFDLKFVKRFTETRLSWDQYRSIKDAIDDAGFVSICTPWDEVSVDRIVEHEYDILKIPSCYLTDWPLLEHIAKTGLPLIASTAGVALQEIDRVVSFFRHRNKRFSLMHCVGEYPTRDSNLQLNQIALLRNRYGNVEVGYSTHERPDNFDAVKVAIGMGARLFEKHVGIAAGAITLNAYSATPDQVRSWLRSAAEALAMCGVSGERYPFTELEIATLRDLQRGVFAKAAIAAGEKLTPANTFHAIPGAAEQIHANDVSKYVDFFAVQPISERAPALATNLRACDRRDYMYQIVGDVKQLLEQAKVAVPGELEMEVSHHYGIENYRKHGSAVITVVNRDYCKRVIVLLPGQSHPEQFHKLKDETYHVLYGDISLSLDGTRRQLNANEVVIIPRGAKHEFSTLGGCVIEEVSSHYAQGDSYYTDPVIEANANRKTFVTYWMDWALGRVD